MNFKGKTIDDAIKEATKCLNVTKEELQISILQEPSKRLMGLIGNKEAIISVSLKDTPIEDLLGYSKEEEKIENNIKFKNNINIEISQEEKKIKIDKGIKFIKEILYKLDYSVELSVREDSDFVYFDISGDNIGKLIGKRGETLYAFQYMVNLVANKNDQNSIKFILDIENFREKRKNTLCDLANRLACKVVDSKRSISLEPMHPIERKIIHTFLQDYKNIETISEGKEDSRYIRIMFRETQK